MGKKTLTRNSLVVFGAMVLNGGSTFLFLIFAGRGLPLGDFGALNVFLAMQTVFGVFSGALILLVAGITAGVSSDDSETKLWGFYPFATKISIAMAMVVTAILLVTSPFWKYAFGIATFNDVLAGTLLVAVNFIIAVPFGYVRGLGRFGLLNAGQAITGALRIILVVALLYLGMTVGKALMILVCSQLAGYLLITKYLLKSKDRSVEPVWEPSFEELEPFFVRAVAVTFFPLFFASADMFLVRYLFSPENSGIYASFTVIGKMILLGAQVIAVALFPLAAAGSAKKEAGASVFSGAMALTLAGGAAVTILCMFYGGEVLGYLFDIDDPEAVAALPYYCSMITAVSLILVEGNYRLASGRFRFPVAYVWAALFQVIVIFVGAGSLKNISLFQSLLFWFFATVAVIRSWLEIDREEPQVE